MRSALCTILLALTLSSLMGNKAQAAGIIYVNINASGTVQDGTSWATAYKSLQAALGTATAGNQIWVARGTYLPTTIGDFNASFFLIDGVALYGGFAGNEPATFNLAFRDFIANTTTLSGSIGLPGSQSHHVVQVLTGTTATAVLDGFTITGGNANGLALVDKTGGGILIGPDAGPTLTNLIISSNNAETEGGGVEIQAGGATVVFTACAIDTNTSQTGAGIITHSAATFTSCQIAGNTATILAGGLEAQAAVTLTGCGITSNKAPSAGGVDLAAPGTLTNVTFLSNAATTANGGGLLVNAGGAGTSLSTCVFTQNTAQTNGGGADAEAAANFFNTTFTSNKATAEGGGLEANAAVTVTQSIFVGNQAVAATALGGAIASHVDLTLTTTSVSGNTAGQDGGGLAEIAGTATVTFCIFQVNSANRGGGARTVGSSTFTNCDFLTNSANTQEGGGIDNTGAQTLMNCVFNNNASALNGGGVRNFQGTEAMTNCVFSNNKAVNGGGFRQHTNNTAMVTNCTFFSNSATGTGSAISLVIGGGFTSAVTVVNTIVWQNAPITNPPIDDAAQNVTFSDIQGIGYTGVGNISANPLFLNPGTPAGGDGIFRTTDDGFKLSFVIGSRSPCIDSGTNAGAPPTDILGNPRAINGVPDMGAYEFSLVPIVVSNLTAVQQDQLLSQVARTYPLPLPGPVLGTSAVGSNVILTTNTANVMPGDIIVAGPGIVAGSVVTLVSPGVSITLSAPAGFGANAGTFFFNGEPFVITGTSTSGGSVITTIDTGNIAVGDLLVGGPGAVGGAKVTALVNNTSITVSVPFGAGAGTGSFTFTPPALPAGSPLLTTAANSAPVLLPPAPPTTTSTGTANAQFEIWDPNTSAPPLNFTFTWAQISGPTGGTSTFSPGLNGYGVTTTAAQSPLTSLVYPGQFLTNNVTVTLSTVGTYAFQVSATNGADTISGVVFVQFIASPAVTSGVTATPSSVALGQSIQFGFGVSDPNASPLTYVWNFGDGTTGTGPNPTHTYTAVGTYTVTVTATNQFGLAVTGSTTVTVNPSPIGNFADSDGDGFPDDLEKFLGSSPFDPNSTPTGSAAIVSAYSVNNNGLKVKLNFKKKGQDTVSLSGTLPRTGQTPTGGLKITFDVAGVLVSFNLDRQGRATITSNGNVGAQVTGSLSPLKNLGTRNSRFNLKLKGDFAATVAPYGLLNANIKNQRVTLRGLVFFGGILYDRFLNLRYTAVQGVSGTTKPDPTAP